MRERIIVTVVLLLVVYEWLAIYLGSWPTITAIIRPHRDVDWVFGAGCVVVLGGAALALIHLFGEGGGW